MIIFMVIGVIPLDALLVAMAGHYWFALGIIALLPPTRMLNKRLNAIT
jgi:4-hydroxybenzoate polyprenyltransferase